jgi:hypothetical protein
MARRVESAHDGHAEVHQHQIRARLSVLLERLLTVLGLSNHRHLRLGRQKRCDACTDEVMVVRREDPNRCRHQTNNIGLRRTRHTSTE